MVLARHDRWFIKYEDAILAYDKAMSNCINYDLAYNREGVN